MTRRDDDRFDAGEIWCPPCRRAQPVREHLPLVPPTGQRFDVTRAVCGTSPSARMEDDRGAHTRLGPAHGDERRR
jgi:hypothetical protein